MADARWIDAHTPTLSVVDSRGLLVRNVAYCRHPLNPTVDTRVTRNHFDSAGRHVASWDPRLWGTGPRPNLITTYNLQTQPLLMDSVDGGWRVSLRDQADSICSWWDGRGSQGHTEFDRLQRPLAVTEWMKAALPRVSERFTYGAADDDSAAHNQCGQLIRHDHPAGSRRLCEFGVNGLLLSEQTRFLRDLEWPDWSSEFAEAKLEDEVFETTQQYAPFGDMLGQIDAMGNARSFVYDRLGQLSEACLKLAGSPASRLLVSDIHYDALGRAVSERAGNGVTTTARYAGEDGYLLQLQACNADGKPLQDFHYKYDPVGNITCIEDKAQLIRHFNNQQIDPVDCYDYDSLYQLIRATGREVSQPSHGPALPGWQTTPLDPNQLRNYTQTFNYDAAGNLQTRHHSGAPAFEMFTALESNRSVAGEGSLVDGFDANGNQLALLRGQKMSWDVRNQLCTVTLVKRDEGPDDTECYRYDSPGHRLRKVRLALSTRRTLRAETRYLPGLEILRDMASGEVRCVVSIEAGHCQVRALHWVTKPPRDVRNDQLRFCLSNHLNSSTLELDERGGLLSREVYYAFGGTALWTGPGETEARYKTIRYSGKERDATGLYYYGYRYYAPWLQRWVSADPGGIEDGLNLFLMTRNCPVSLRDNNGLKGENAVLGLPEKLGKWHLERLQLSHSELLRNDTVGNNIVAHITLSYRPDWRDRLLGRFQEMPDLIWREKITVNDFSKKETWSFDADMFDHNPSSRTLEIWPKRYLEAFNSSAGYSGLARGSVELHDTAGRKVDLKDLGEKVSDNKSKSRAVRSYLSQKGGSLSFEIHDVPAIPLREGTHKERLLEIRVGLNGAKTTAAINQYLYVDTTREGGRFERLIDEKSVGIQNSDLRAVDAPTIVSNRRPYTKFPGEFFNPRSSMKHRPVSQ